MHALLILVVTENLRHLLGVQSSNVLNTETILSPASYKQGPVGWLNDVGQRRNLRTHSCGVVVVDIVGSGVVLLLNSNSSPIL